MNEPPDDQDNHINESEDSARSHDIGEPFADGEQIGGLSQLYKKVKLMIIGDPAALNASKHKTEQLNSFINDPNAKEQTQNEKFDLKREEFSKSILSIWKKRGDGEKLSNIYPIDPDKKNRTPKPPNV